MSDAGLDLKHAMPLPGGLRWCGDCAAAVEGCRHALGPPTPRNVNDLLMAGCVTDSRIRNRFVEISEDNERLRSLPARIIEACARIADDEARHGYSGTCHDIANRIRTEVLTLPELP